MATIFSRIIAGEIPSVCIHDDDICTAILDIAPVNKGHVLVITKQEYETLLDCPDEEISHLMRVVKLIAARMEEVLNMDGFNIMVNNKPASGQEVPHLHIHIIPRFKNDGKTPRMIKESYTNGEMAAIGERLRV